MMKRFFSSLAIGILLSTSTSQAADDWKQELEEFPAKSESGYEIPCRLLRPPKSDDATVYPLVLFLHGAGERGDDNRAQLTHGVAEFYQRRNEHPCFVLAPQCPTGERWVEVDWNRETGTGTFGQSPSKPMAAAWGAVRKLLKEESVDPTRVYVTGLSMGGFGTWFAAGHYRASLAAAAPVCGGGDPSWAAKYEGLPLWAAHGIDDSAVPVKRTREMVDAIRSAGGGIGVTEYPDVGHNSWTPFYADDQFHDWLFAQRRSE